MRNTALIAALLLPTAAAAAPPEPAPRPGAGQMAMRCSAEGLVGSLPSGVRLTQAAMQAPGPVVVEGRNPNGVAPGDGTTIGEHCLLRGQFEERTGARGKPYAIGFELRVPANWNGRLLYQGGGGLNGSVQPAMGANASHGSTAKVALARGFAVVSTDSGHQGQDASFAEDQEAKLNYGYGAIGKVTVLARRLVGAVAGKAPDRTYFEGCSNGGREAMIAAQRHPELFDGVVAGDPAFHLSAATVLASYSQQAYSRIAPAGPAGAPLLPAALTPADMRVLSRGILARCDALDGVSDGMVFNHAACRFDPAEVQCRAGQADDCLPAAKVSAIRAAFAGPRTRSGQPIASSWVYDPGVAGQNWREWQTGVIQDGKARDFLPKLVTETLARYFSYPPIAPGVVARADPGALLAAIAPTAAITDATATQMSSFAAKGGKMLLVTGWADPIFTPNDLIAWYGQLSRDGQAAGNGAVEDWSRLFLVPGMNHCGGGPALDDFDVLSVLVDWVEKGRAPDSFVARGKSFPGVSRPICAYPRRATYDGHGPVNDAASFTCG